MEKPAQFRVEINNKNINGTSDVPSGFPQKPT